MHDARRDRFLPILYARLNSFYDDRCAEYRSVKMARMVPFGLFHISFRLYSRIRAAFGVIVAHFTATPYFFVASAESIVT